MATGKRPEDKLVRTPLEAERLSAEYMRWLGFTGVRLTATGPDGGVDVVAHEALAQVKAEMRPAGRPAIQSIYGLASLEGKHALFFSLSGYTREAMSFATRAGVALFTYDRRGRLEAANEAGQVLIPQGDGEASAGPTNTYIGNGGQRRGNAQRTGAYSGSGPANLAAPAESLDDTPLSPSPQFAVVDNTIVAWDSDNNLVAYRDSQVLWRLGLGLNERHAEKTHPVYVDDVILVSAALDEFSGTGRVRVWSIDARTGAQRWVRALNNVDFVDDLLVTSDAFYIYGGRMNELAEEESVIHAFALQTGRRRWEHVFTDVPEGWATGPAPPIIAAGREAVLVGYKSHAAHPYGGESWDPSAENFGYLTALDSRTGKPLWRLADVAVVSLVVGRETVLVDAAFPDPWFTGVVALDIHTGRVLWRRQGHQDHDTHQNEYCYFESVIVLGPDPDFAWLAHKGSEVICCVSLVDGAEEWRFRNGLRFIDAAMAGTALLVALLGEGGTDLIALDPARGQELRRARRSDKIRQFVAIDGASLYFYRELDVSMYRIPAMGGLM